MFQVFVKNSVEAVKFYQKAFDATLECEYFDKDKKYYEHLFRLSGAIKWVEVTLSSHFGV